MHLFLQNKILLIKTDVSHKQASSFYSHVNDQHLHFNRTTFHMKGSVLGLTFKQRRNATRKSPIY